MLPECDFQVLRLTNSFYDDYPESDYKEILRKQPRGYTCLLFQTHDYFICIPYRTEMHHKNGYRFKHSIRSRNNASGLDYSKIVIISNTDYLESHDAIVDQDEYNETISNIEKIKKDSLAYVENYVGHQLGRIVINENTYKRRYQFTSLKYFHDELGI